MIYFSNLQKICSVKTVAPKASMLLAYAILFFIVSSCATTMSTEEVTEEAHNKRNIGEANIMQGNYTAALKELLEAEKLNPKDPVVQNYLGIVYKEKDMPDLAIEHFKKAIDLNSGYSQARNNLGVTYLDKGDWDSAITCFKDVLSDILYATPQYPLANIGRAYFNKKDYELAESYYNKALKEQANFIIALNGLGETYMATKNYTKAIDVYEKAVQYNDASPFLQYQLARAYELSYAFKKAIDAYQNVIDISPDGPLAKDAKTAKAKLESYF